LSLAATAQHRIFGTSALLGRVMGFAFRSMCRVTMNRKVIPKTLDQALKHGSLARNVSHARFRSKLIGNKVTTRRWQFPRDLGRSDDE
jgi:hypothetical protein